MRAAAGAGDRQRVTIRYEGRTRLTAIGPGTGASYSFSHPGAVLSVDPRDWRALAALPKLRRVKGR